MFTSFVCCALLALNLRANSNLELGRAPMLQNTSTLSIANVKVSDIENQFEGAIDKLMNTNADVVCFQEVNPFWNKVIESVLENEYPNDVYFSNKDGSGIAIFSKYTLHNPDTFHHGQQLSVITNIHNKDQIPISILCTQLTSLEDKNEDVSLQPQIAELIHVINRINGPLITTGSFSLADWSSELSEFRQVTRLANSSRGYIPSVLSSINSALYVPTDHLFYSPELNCVSFNNVRYNSNRIGIVGVYQVGDISDYVGS